MSDLAWLDEIERRAAAATPGPLVARCSPYIEPWTGWYVETENRRLVANALNEADARFYAYSRNDVLHLCQAVRELHEALRKAVCLIPSALVDELNAIGETLRRWERGGA